MTFFLLPVLTVGTCTLVLNDTITKYRYKKVAQLQKLESKVFLHFFAWRIQIQSCNRITFYDINCKIEKSLHILNLKSYLHLSFTLLWGQTDVKLSRWSKFYSSPIYLSPSSPTFNRYRISSFTPYLTSHLSPYLHRSETLSILTIFN